MISFINQYLFKVKKVTGILLGIGFLIITGFPFPLIVVQILIGITFFLSIFYLIWSLTKKPFYLKKKDSVISLCVCLFLIATDINTTRTILLGDFSSGIFKFGKSIINTPLKAVILLGIYSVLAAILVYLVLRNVTLSSEVGARFCLESMNQKVFEIDNQLCNKKITKQEADFYKNQVREEVDFYSNLEANSKFLTGITYCVVLFSVIQLFGGGVVAYEKLNMNLETMIIEYCRITSLIGILFLICLLIICLAFKTGSLRGAVIKPKFNKDLLSDYDYANYSYRFTISLGSDLNCLIMNENTESVLGTLIKEFNLEMDLPTICFREDCKLHSTEYVVSWNGKTKRGILDLREGEELCATEIVEAVRELWES